MISLIRDRFILHGFAEGVTLASYLILAFSLAFACILTLYIAKRYIVRFVELLLTKVTALFSYNQKA